MEMSKEEMRKRMWMKHVTKRNSIVNPPSISTAPPAGGQALEEEPAVAAVSVPATSAMAGDLDSQTVGSEEIAGEVVVPTLVSVVEDVMAPSISATLPVPEQSIPDQSGEDRLCNQSGFLGILGCDEEADTSVRDTVRPVRTGHDGAGGTEGVLALVEGPKLVDVPCASNSLAEELAGLISADLLSRFPVPVEGEPLSRKRRRESESPVPPSPSPSPVATNPLSVPPSSGSFSYIPELGNLQDAALWFGERSLTSVRRALLEQLGAREQMKEAFDSMSKVCHFMANFATKVSRNFPLELSGAQERIAQLEDGEEQYKASLNFLGLQRDRAEEALADAEERIARRDARLQEAEKKTLEAEKKLIDKDRRCAMLSRRCSRLEDEVRYLRNVGRRPQESEHPGQRGSRLIEGSSRRDTERPDGTSSAGRPDHQSEGR